MINPNMHFYKFYKFGEPDSYGQQTLPEDPTGFIKMSIYLSSQSVQGNINYKDCQYIGLTQEPIDESYVISYRGEKLKVLYFNNQGRYTQVYMSQI